MTHQILLITPPFTQLNTPYPATAFLKGFLSSKNISVHQADLGIEVINELFSEKGLSELFEIAGKKAAQLSEKAARIVSMRRDYVRAIGSVMSFLQGRNPTVAELICADTFLPESSRFEQADNLESLFGTMGVTDKAKHLATLFLEDVSDLIVEAVDPDFGFSRYAEKLGQSAPVFDTLQERLSAPETLIDTIMLRVLKEKIAQFSPPAVGFSIPFPGCLYGALKCAQWLKKNYPATKVIFGGGYVNTELRSLTDTRIFNFADFITLDDGEAPLLDFMEHISCSRKLEKLKRTFAVSEGKVKFFNGSETPDSHPKETGTPDYSGLPLDKYISVLETANPMHRLWSDGRWNKLMLAHGCYWGKCTFCDTSLDYIKRYEPVPASVTCDRMEALIRQTGQTGFHFTDEAAPPALLKELALEIIRRNLAVAWWTNIRFEKNFTYDLCRLLKESGCIAVSGGLETASDRLLKLINKGVTVSQVAKVADNFTRAGIMVHAYLMYGFPTQTAQETIDSLETVRQLFLNGVIQSAFWHRFAMTVHSEVGCNPGKFKVSAGSPSDNPFANNEIVCTDTEGCRHSDFSEGLRVSLFNYMRGTGLELPLGEWFKSKVPRTTVPHLFITDIISSCDNDSAPLDSQLIWLGNAPYTRPMPKKSKGGKKVMCELCCEARKGLFSIKVEESAGRRLCELLPKLSPESSADRKYTAQALMEEFSELDTSGKKDFFGRVIPELRDYALLII